ncbi:hypothetical protein RD792_005578 [Penstemon davidsonii]|uniref:Uncharacterized protein n=1 Tax=Penstemon davidsonii TaxID=160366 RepID=A0ABR0DFY6_9LAMI|nr:hypothetical protein RD792_005578 [Penstemon davidsonii]
MSLEEFLLAKGISAEKVLEIEYIKAVAPRKEEEPSLHDDWVSAVDGSSDRFILTGCYDGFGRIWRNPGNCTHILDGHSGPVTSVCFFKPKGPSKSEVMVLTESPARPLERLTALLSVLQIALDIPFLVLCKCQTSAKPLTWRW